MRLPSGLPMNYDLRMKTPTTQQKLKALTNLARFHRASKIPRRTLDRVRAGDGNPSESTLRLIEMALLSYNEKDEK